MIGKEFEMSELGMIPSRSSSKKALFEMSEESWFGRPVESHHFYKSILVSPKFCELSTTEDELAFYISGSSKTALGF